MKVSFFSGRAFHPPKEHATLRDSSKEKEGGENKTEEDSFSERYSKEKDEADEEAPEEEDDGEGEIAVDEQEEEEEGRVEEEVEERELFFDEETAPCSCLLLCAGTAGVAVLPLPLPPPPPSFCLLTRPAERPFFKRREEKGENAFLLRACGVVVGAGDTRGRDEDEHDGSGRERR